eukprot:CAMPEP_0114479100 /NCGR_PEP_ID=MMETSP0104-20121206/16365_1 /TAXON_ID=37642 ORGANISM="Paraphysomonas imperforata, Strain PA2" /NCGR_SAMPLE_ID=MMETSP0104 /ASSEMBLY_ACC=CAM_ASM_000202 /LENGTH=49 /DNA_ID= /DNA_START= /DNA_END= /DNA_ORIENTATION=
MSNQIRVCQSIGGQTITMQRKCRVQSGESKALQYNSPHIFDEVLQHAPP